ncbi:MAG: 50S ribosomal protein L32e [Candidatus Thermoplasmatota archaeon]|nr:50S ribosomal protein L32e [Candidatus Thermoplasmatota archaeon]
MAKDDIIQNLTSLKGIGQAKAEALVNEGYDTIKKIQSASIDELTKVKGINENVARSLQSQLSTKTSVSKNEEKKSTETKEKKPVKRPVASKPPKKLKSEPVEPETTDIDETKEDIYVAKKKPKLSDDLKKHLSLRKDIKKRTPEFLREEWFRYKRIPKNWRRPDGITSKMRRHYKYRPSVVRVGFRGPKKTRGLHASGFKEILVYRASDLESLNPETQAARIGGSVGTKKRLEIEKKAKELDIRLLNK